MYNVSAPAVLRVVPWLIALLAIGVAHAARIEALPHVAQRIEARQPLHITAFGSSSTEGIGATSKARCYPARLAGDLLGLLPKGVDVVVLNRGIGGEDVDDMMLRLPNIIAEKPDLVIWQTGSNDELRSVKLDHFIAATRDGIAQMQAAGIDVILMEPQLSPRLASIAGSDAYLEAVRAVGREMNVIVIRRHNLMRQWLATGTLTYPEMMSGDGLHMTDRSYDLLAQSVAAIIVSSSTATPHVAAQ